MKNSRKLPMGTMAVLVAAGALISLQLAACGYSEAEKQERCDEIAELCHPSTTEAGQACHEEAEGTDLDACSDSYDECVAACS